MAAAKAFGSFPEGNSMNKCVLPDHSRNGDSLTGQQQIYGVNQTQC